MAIGDLVGDLATAYLTPAQRLAKLGGAVKQTSFDATNTPGVVGRASQQVQPVSLASLAPGGAAATPAPTAPAQPMSLASLSPGGTAPAQQPAPAPLSLASAGQKQTSFDQTNTAAKYMQPNQPQSLASLAPVGVLPTATSPTYPAPAQQRAADLRDAGPTDTPLPAPMASLESAYRPTGVGQGSNAIAGRIGANGTAEFSNTPTDLASAAGLAQLNTAPREQASTGPVSLADIMPGTGAAPGSNADFASLGSARNLGDGVGTFSQANAGDSALAMGRFQRANDLRAGYRAQDNADLAAYRARQGASINVVRDSSQPYTREDKALDLRDAMKQQGLEANAAGAQKSLEDLRTGQANARDVIKTQRLEDILSAGTAPNATPEQRAAVQRIQDPDNSKALGRQLIQAQIDDKQASTTKTLAETAALGTAGPKLTEGQSKDLNYYGRGNAANKELETQGAGLTNAAVGDRSAGRGVLDSTLRSLPGIGNSGVVNSLISNDRQKAEQSGQEFVNAILRKDSGAALTDPEIATYGRTYLPQPGDGEAVLKQKQEARTRAISGIREGLGSAAVLAAEVNRPEYKPPVTAAAAKVATPAAPVQISTEQAYRALASGAQYIDPQGNHRSKP